ncbi:cytochrome c maturation protein CcmE domain-containing protein [Arundinibacter roseus]|uniref:Cytochrome c maturation protein CcmE n=1 Tax=Arundinibacter roseus TaxID=2070510 RepID=A0A4V2XAM4_9BACT|nr:cytochrome c maturation protein CcmE [Arundinibacter roseus]TDB68185.1 cytochrome c maturation protein CcmE [Arundinibacter roseus]
MKKIHIFGIAVIAIAIAIIVSTAGDASTYVNFSQAEELAMNGSNGSIHVVGKLKKDQQGQILDMAYKPELDPNYFVFTLLDNNNREQKVVYRSPKPQDFEKSEQVVVIGRMEKDHFEAEKILLKCPSKYNNEKLETTEYQASKL